MANIRYKVGDTWYDVGSMGGSISEITVDSQLSETSANPVENRVITKALEDSKEVSVSSTTPTGDEVLWINPDGTGGGGSSGGGGKLYLHKVNLTGTYLIDIYSSYSTTFTYESFVAYLNKIARDIPCYIWADDGRAKYQLTRVGYISSAGIYTGWYDGNEYNDVYTYSIESDTVTEL